MLSTNILPFRKPRQVDSVPSPERVLGRALIVMIPLICSTGAAALWAWRHWPAETMREVQTQKNEPLSASAKLELFSALKAIKEAAAPRVTTVNIPHGLTVPQQVPRQHRHHLTPRWPPHHPLNTEHDETARLNMRQTQ